jgi:hypothetical protein
MEGDPFERFNWDAPILVSPHNPKRLYFASQRVWRSENRGDDWTAISKDLTLNQNRLQFPYYGKQQSWDNAWDVYAMSNYNTITSLAESPKQEGLVYAGTDDGIIQTTENGGDTWRKFTLSSIKGLEHVPFVNDVRADLHDANVVYAAVDNHKYGDFKPYILKSTNKGKSWKIISGDLPKKLLVWRLVQDHVDKNLIFAATEYGIYFTYNGGENWLQLKGGVPTISFRDIAIQRRENDLVGASFGRGFFILDDISPLRNFNASIVKEEATLFPIKDAYWYREWSRVGSQGDGEYKAPNAPFGARFTYFMADKVKSLKEVRQEKEKTNVTFPQWDALEEETNQETPQILLIIKDASGKIVNTVRGTNSKGFNRVNWKLNYPDKRGERLSGKGDGVDTGNILVTPGTYSVTLVKRVDGVTTTLQEAQEFKVVPLYEGTLPRKSYDEINQFREDVVAIQQDLTATNLLLDNQLHKIAAMKRAANKTSLPNNELITAINLARLELLAIQKELRGDPVKGQVGEKSNPTANDAASLSWRAFGNTYGPTGTQKKFLNRVTSQLKKVKSKLSNVVENTMPSIEKSLQEADAPWIEGQGLIKE